METSSPNSNQNYSVNIKSAGLGGPSQNQNNESLLALKGEKHHKSSAQSKKKRLPPKT